MCDRHDATRLPVTPRCLSAAAPPSALVFAAWQPTSDEVLQMILLAAAAVALVIIVAVIAHIARKKLVEPTVEIDGTSFSMEQLRDLHAQGLLSDDEFERAKFAIVEKMKRDDD